MMWYYKILLFLVILKNTLGNPANIVFGGVFDENDDEYKIAEAFKFAVDLANSEQGSSDLTFSPLIEDVGEKGPFGAMSITLSFIEKNAVAIFGPRREESIDIVQSVCDTEDIIHIISRWVFKPLHYTNTINFYPHSDVLSLAYYDIIKAYHWESFTICYENNESLLRMGDLMKRAKDEGIVVSIKQLDEKKDGNFRITLKNVLKSGERNLVIDCSIEILEEVLLHAQQVGMMTSQYNYFITNLDMHTIHTDQFRYSEANITGIRIVNPESDIVVEKTTMASEDYSIPDATKLRTETALLIDAATILSIVIKEQYLIRNLVEDVKYNTSKSLFGGTTLLNFLKGKQHEGLTGFIRFDNQGFRSSFDLNIHELRESGIVPIGMWNSTAGLRISSYNSKLPSEDEHSLRNRSFIVSIALTHPYAMLKENAVPLYGNERFEGFAIDLIGLLSEMEGFNYTFIVREDGANGEKLKTTGEWTGMIRDVMDGVADLAITDLTVTSDREEAVDFTSPFMNLGISILARKPSNAPPSFFSFADPFALDTWIMLVVAYVVVSISLFIMGRLCPAEWTNPYPCIEEPEFLMNQFSLQNSAWFAIGSLMQQGTEIAPIAISTRMVAGMWWFFVLLMVSSYTANLAAFLTTENPIVPFSDVQSLVEVVEENKFTMGAKLGGATETFFKKAEDPIFKKIGQYMETHKENMVTKNEYGVTRAEEEDYAFFMESTSIKYATERHCDLQQYGDLLDDKGYAIAMRKNSTYRSRLSLAILKLQSNGEIDKIERKWWNERRGGGLCNAETETSEANPLNLKNVEGVFYVTIIGSICSMVAVVIELILYSIKISVKTKTPLKEVLIGEFKAYLNFSSNTKPAIQDTSQSKSGSESPKESVDKNVESPAPYGFIPGISREPLTSDI